MITTESLLNDLPGVVEAGRAAGKTPVASLRDYLDALPKEPEAPPQRESRKRVAKRKRCTTVPAPLTAEQAAAEERDTNHALRKWLSKLMKNEGRLAPSGDPLNRLLARALGRI